MVYGVIQCFGKRDLGFREMVCLDFSLRASSSSDARRDFQYVRRFFGLWMGIRLLQIS